MSKPGSSASPPLSTADATRRAVELFKLGNSLGQIRSALERSKATPEEIESALEEVARLERDRRESGRRAVWLMGGAAVAAFAIIAGLGAWVSARSEGRALTATPDRRQPPTARPAASSPPLSGPTVPATAPSPGLLPGGALATAMQAPTPHVLRGSGPPISRCPSTPGRAAELFGGSPDYWSYSSDYGGGWVMIAPAAPVTVRVPANMSAGYLVAGKALQINSVLGPATISNVNLVIITCEP